MNNKAGRTRVLIVDDILGQRETIADFLEKHDYETYTVADGQSAIKALKENPTAAAIVDIKLPDTSGEKLAARLNEINPDLEIILMTGYASVDTAIGAVKSRVSAYLTKPLDIDLLLAELKKAIEHRRLVLSNRKLVEELKRELYVRRRSETEIKRQAEEQTLLLDTMENQVWYLKDIQTYGMVNQAHAKFLGRKREELENKTLSEIVSREEAEVCIAGNAKAFKEGKTVYSEEWLKNNQGERRLFSITKTPNINEDGKVEYLVCVGTDITESKRTEETLARQARQQAEVARFGQLALSGIPLDELFNEAVILISRVLKTKYAKVLEHKVELGVLLLRAGVGWKKGCVGYKSVPDRDGSQGGYTLLQNKPVITEDIHHETRFYPPDLLLDHNVVSGMTVAISGISRPFGILGVHTDRIQRFHSEDAHFMEAIANILAEALRQRQAEEELLNARKLESLGILAGGIAHDFNNILTTILGNISFIRTALSPAGDEYEALVDAEEGCREGKNLTQQLLTFSRGGSPVKKTIDISMVLTDTASFVLRGSNVCCRFEIAPDLRSLDADAGQLHQVISNIIINADHSMPEGGTVTVKAENVTIGMEDSIPLEEGDYVRISISDTGIGIKKENISLIFDPYFTTSSTGSGLGLAGVYSIVKNHGGLVTVESEPGIGTTFLIYLPASDRKTEARKKPQENVVKGHGRILLMDDDEMIRNVAGRLIKWIGYEVDTATNGREAIEKYREAKKAGTPFDVVILDLTVPGGMGGKEALPQLKEIDPGVKAIVSSGYSSDSVMADYAKAGFAGVIPKPYKISTLSRILDKVIKNTDIHR